MKRGGLKEISKLKIAVTSDCCLDCRHCRIDKKAGRTISMRDASAAVETLLSSPGRVKRLELYGGEALLKLPLLERICSYAYSRAARRGKALVIWLASNGVLLGERELEFVRRNKILLSVSLYGTRKSHDFVRVFPGGRGSFFAVRRSLRSVFSQLDPLRVTALLCVHPKFSGSVFSDFSAIEKAGFRVINIECVHGTPWSKAAMAAFEAGLERIAALIMERARSGHFIVPEPLLELVSTAASRGGEVPPCPFHQDLEVFPDGVFSLYPFGFVDMNKYSAMVTVGRSGAGFSGRFRNCHTGSEDCRDCLSRYYRVPGMTGGAEAYALRTRFFTKFLSGLILDKSKTAREYLSGVVKLSRVYRGV